MAEPEYRYGVTGFVKLLPDRAEKYSNFNSLYWLKEHSVLLYLASFRTDSIIRFTGCKFLVAQHPEDKIMERYLNITFPRYPTTLQNRKFYTDKNVLQFLADMSAAVAFLHEHHIMHRDIKPANIAINADNRPILIDFSHAHRKVFEISTLNSEVITYPYRAPEVFAYCRKEEPTYDESVDVYSLGMVLFEIICGSSFEHFYTAHLPNEEKYKSYEELVKNPADFYRKLKETYSIRQRSFSMCNQYFKWITRMIANVPGDRITAEELNREVWQFAESKGIQLERSVHGEHQPLALPELKKDPVDEEFLSECINYAETTKQKFSMVFELSRVKALIKILVQDGFITDQNYVNTVPAVLIIVETVLYDDFTELYDDYEVVNIQFIIGAIADAIVKYDRVMYSKEACVSYDRT